MRSFITGCLIAVLLVSRTTIAKPTSHNLVDFDPDTALKMSSPNNENSGVRVPRASNSPLLDAALSLNSAVSSGKITPNAAREAANRLIQANKQATNLQILNGSLGK